MKTDDKQILFQIYEPLLKLDSDCQTVLPHLVHHWEESADRLKYRFEIRPDVRFHDGNFLRVRDVVWSFSRFSSNAPSSLLSRLIRSVDIIDSLQFSITLHDIYEPFLSVLASPHNLVIMPVETAEDILTRPCGTGPYKFKSENNRSILRLTSFRDYWAPALFEVVNVIFVVAPDEQQSPKIFREKSIDILFMVSGSQLDRLKWLGNIDYYVRVPDNIIYIGFNSLKPPFNDRRVRMAVLKAIDLRKLVLNINRGNAMVASGPVPPIYKGFSDIQQAKYDLKEARRLLHDLGYENGFEIKFSFPKIMLGRMIIIELLKTEFQKVGIKLKVRPFETWEAHDRYLYTGEGQMFMDGWTTDNPGEPAGFLYSLFHSKSQRNTMRYSNALVDSLLESANTVKARSSRHMIYRRIVKLIIDDTPAVFVSHVYPHFAYNSKKIKTITANHYQILQFHLMALQ